MNTPRLTIERVQDLVAKLYLPRTADDWPLSAQDEDDLLLMGLDLIDAHRAKPENAR
jgi:hypothetical protein